MIQMQTNLDVADNSGARRVMCIKVLGGSKRRYATVGRRHVVSIKGSNSARQGEEGRRHEGRRVRVRKDIRRADGSVIRFDRNAAVLINNQSEAGRHPHLRAGAARAARQESHEDHLACAGGAVMAAKIRKGDKVIVAERPRQGPYGEGVRGAAPRGQGAGPRGQSRQAAPEADPGAGGRLISKESPIHLSNIAFVGKDGKPTRVGFKIQADGKKLRIAKRSGAEIDG